MSSLPVTVDPLKIDSERSVDSLKIDNERSLEDMEDGFKLTDAMYFCRRGMEVRGHSLQSD